MRNQGQDQGLSAGSEAQIASTDGATVKLSTDWEALKQSLEVLKGWTSDQDWYGTLSFDMALAPDFEQWLVGQIRGLIHDTPTGDDLETYLQSLRQQTNSALSAAEGLNGAVARWHAYRVTYAHYGFIETVIEASVFSETILNRLKQALGPTWLKQLTVIDRLEPSKLTNIHDVEASADTRILANPAVRDYLILKRWQDDQNMYHNSVIEPVFAAARKAFMNHVKSSGNSHLGELGARNALAAILVTEAGRQPLEVVARLSLADIDETLTAVIGGKGLGLAKLMATPRRIPATWLLPVGASTKGLTDGHWKGQRWAVRSSATVEDGTKNSFAGMFTSELDVPTVELTSAVERVRASVTSPRVSAYTARFKTKTPRMAIVLQQYREPSASGIWVGLTRTKGELSWVKGSGEKIVSGATAGTTEKWLTRSETANRLMAGSQPVGISCLNLQRTLGTRADFEWAILDGELIWLQYRPVTSDIVTRGPSRKAKAGELTGTPASAGKATGTAILLEEPDSDIWVSGSILVAPLTDPDWVVLMTTAKALVTSEGSALCHAAIIARELEIPCVTNVADAMDKIPNHATITVDGDAGIVTIRK